MAYGVTTFPKGFLSKRAIRLARKWAARYREIYSRVLFVALLILCAEAIVYVHVRIATPQPVKVTSQSQAITTSTAPETLNSNALFATRPTWTQDFAHTAALDKTYWTPAIGPANNDNNEQQYYTNDLSNLRIEDGALKLTATNVAREDGYNYQSSRIETAGKKTFLYGRLDFVAKLPQGTGTWPAIWMLAANDTYANMSPATDTMRAKNGGEIDIMEAVGFMPDKIYGIAHSRSDETMHPGDYTGSFDTVKVNGSTTAYHTYTLLWTPTSLSYQVDGQTYYTYIKQADATYASWPFDQPFYLIMNLALGGSWGGMSTKYADGIDASALPGSLDIRSINYYKYIGQNN